MRLDAGEQGVAVVGEAHHGAGDGLQVVAHRFLNPAAGVWRRHEGGMRDKAARRPPVAGSNPWALLNEPQAGSSQPARLDTIRHDTIDTYLAAKRCPL